MDVVGNSVYGETQPAQFHGSPWLLAAVMAAAMRTISAPSRLDAAGNTTVCTRTHVTYAMWKHLKHPSRVTVDLSLVITPLQAQEVFPVQVCPVQVCSWHIGSGAPKVKQTEWLQPWMEPPKGKDNLNPLTTCLSGRSRSQSKASLGLVVLVRTFAVFFSVLFFLACAQKGAGNLFLRIFVTSSFFASVPSAASGFFSTRGPSVLVSVLNWLQPFLLTWQHLRNSSVSL